MITRNEVKEIEDRFNHYFFNCDDWSIGDIEARLRLDFSGKTSMTEGELFRTIDQICWSPEATCPLLD